MRSGPVAVMAGIYRTERRIVFATAIAVLAAALAVYGGWRQGARLFGLRTVAAATRTQGTPQNPMVAGQAAQPKPLRDMALEGASALIGRAMILRGCYTGGELTFDAMGRVKGEPKVTDWTLAGVNIEKVTRRGTGMGAGELQLDGVRVAMRFNPDQRVFERHPLKDQKLKIILAVNNDARGLQGALAMMFAVGIDPGLQRAMPAYWRHYFSQKLEWPNDDLTGQTVISANASMPAGVEFPVIEKKVDPGYTAEANQDHVKGLVQLKMTVGTDGLPRRIAIKQPLGYGLDARVVEAAGKYRFRPGTKDGKPVAVEMLVNQQFDYPGPR